MRDVDGRRFYAEAFEKLFNESEHEVASIMLKLYDPVVFSYDDEAPRWGATKSRTGSLRQQQPSKVSPSSSVLEVRTSPSSCLSGEAVQTPHKKRKEDLGEISSMYEGLKRENFTKRNIFPALDNFPEDMEIFSNPAIHELMSESRRMFIEQRDANLKEDIEDSP